MPSTRSTEPAAEGGRWVRTVDDALEFVRSVGLCLIFADKGSSKRAPLPTLWDVVDAPDKRPSERGFGERVGLVWRLKNELPMTYPDEVFYGKLRGGRAMLCTIDKLRDVYQRQRQAPDAIGRDARRLLEIIRLRPITSGDLRLDAGFHQPDSRSRFDRALQELQIALLIARVDVDPDTWFLFDAAYPRFAEQVTDRRRRVSDGSHSSGRTDARVSPVGPNGTPKVVKGPHWSALMDD